MFTTFLYYVKGEERRLDLQFHSGDSIWRYVCQMCGRGAADWCRRDTLTPIDLPDDNPENAVQSGATLCESCCLSPDIGAGWPGLSLEEMRAVWVLVRKEQAREISQQAAREGSVATCLQEIQAATAAMQKAIADERVNDSRKVA